jgi:hypothetical protein
MAPSNVVIGLGVAVAVALWSAPAVALDDGLEDPNACTSPFGGGDSREGTVITVPGGTTMPIGTPPAPPSSIPGAPYPPPLTTYVCSNGGWVPVSSALEVGLRVDPDGPAVTVDEGSAAVMSGTYTYAGEAAVDLTASIGQVTDLGAGTWTWSLTPDDGPATQSVTITATDGDQSGTATFDLVVNNLAPTATNVVPVNPVALVGQPVAFAGSATDPSASDIAAGFTWSYDPDPAQFGSCGNHTVTATATDQDGGVSASVISTPVTVVQSAFGPPLAAGSHNLVRAGQVVPVRVNVGCDGNSVGGLNPSLQLIRGDLDPATTWDDPDVVVPTVDAKGDTTGAMREAGDAYLYNLQVPAAATGTLFTVRVSPATGSGAVYAVLEIR